jgi:general secretion pathway protein K
MRKMNAKQSGIALVTVLLVVAIATVMAVAMVQEQQGSIHITRGFLSRGQASQYALGGEELARQILQEDYAEGDNRDYLAETWASPDLHFEFEDGEVNLQITDLQGLFNVNSLSTENRTAGIARQRLVNLLSSMSVDPMLADRLQDWIDADTSARPTGAEDFEYLVYEPPYRTGNAMVQDVSEVGLLGLEREVLQQVLPFLTALPDARTHINVNTASAYILQALAPELSFDTADALVQRREELEEGFESVEAFLQLPELAGVGVATDGLGVQSSFFEVRTIARYQERFSYLTSILHRNSLDGSIRVIYRDFSKNFRPQQATVEDTDG